MKENYDRVNLTMPKGQKEDVTAHAESRGESVNAFINRAIGHIKLADLRPQHLNSFYKNLAEPGIRISGGSAKAKIDIVAWLKKNKLSRGKLAEKAGIPAATVGIAVKGESIKIEISPSNSPGHGEKGG